MRVGGIEAVKKASAEPEHCMDETCWCHPVVIHYGPPDQGVDMVVHYSLAECLTMYAASYSTDRVMTVTSMQMMECAMTRAMEQATDSAASFGGCLKIH